MGQTATLVPVATDDDGKIKEMINLSYTNPYDYLSRPFSRLIAEAEEGEDKGEGMINRYTQGFMYAVGERKPLELHQCPHNCSLTL